VPPAPATVTVPVAVPVRDTTKAKVTGVKVPASIKLASLRRTGTVSASFVSNEAGSATGQLTAPVSGFTAARAIATVVLAQRTAKVAAGKRTTVKLKVGKAARKRLRRGRRLVLTVAVGDTAGNVTRVKRTIRLR
jgi:hypothetical protein